MATITPLFPDRRWEITTVSQVAPLDSGWMVSYAIRAFRWCITPAADALPTAQQVGDPVALLLEDNAIIRCFIIGDQVVKGAIPDELTLADLMIWRDTTLALRTYHARHPVNRCPGILPQRPPIARRSITHSAPLLPLLATCGTAGPR